MATAVHIPVLAIFGSSVKELGFYPSGSKNIVIANSALKCRPCSHIGRKSCPRKHFRCMRDIKPDLVIKQFNKLMA
jgi:heptosyltransferase-2